MIVELRQVTKRFGDRVAVDGLDLSVPAGACFGLLGPNGAGKTTTLRMVYGVTRPTSGSIRVFGLDVAREARAVRARLGVTLQENVLIDASRRSRTCASSAAITCCASRSCRGASTSCSTSSSCAARERARPAPLGRLQAPARDRAVADQPPRAADPRRADHRPRSRGAPGAVDARARAARARHDGAADDALHGRGRAPLRPRRDHRRRDASSPRLAGRADPRAPRAQTPSRSTAAPRRRRRLLDGPALRTRLRVGAGSSSTPTTARRSSNACARRDGGRPPALIVRPANLEDVFLRSRAARLEGGA